MRWYADWLRQQVNKLGIEVRYHGSPDIEQLRPFIVEVGATSTAIRELTEQLESIEESMDGVEAFDDELTTMLDELLESARMLSFRLGRASGTRMNDSGTPNNQKLWRSNPPPRLALMRSTV